MLEMNYEKIKLQEVFYTIIHSNQYHIVILKEEDHQSIS